MDTKVILFAALAVVSLNAMADNGFAGSYAGVGLGYVQGDDKNQELSSGVPDSYTSHTKPSGIMFGVEAGHNWIMRGNMLVGIEGSYDIGSANDKRPADNAGVPDPQYPIKTELKSNISIRARAGRLFNDGRTVAYVTAGLAQAKIKRSYFDTTATPDSQSGTNNQSGWTVGFGVEHFIRDRLTVRAEYRYSDYGKATVDASQIYGAGYTEQQKYKDQLMRASIVYHY